MDVVLPSQGDNIIRTRDLDVPWDKHGLAHMLFHAAKQHTSKIAQINAETGNFCTYDDFLQKSIRVAIAMRLHNIKPDDIVCLCSRNDLDVFVAYFATLLVGGIITALDPSQSKEDMEHLLLQVTPKMMIASQKCEKLIEAVLASIDKTSELIIFGQSDRHVTFDTFLVASDPAEEELFKPHQTKDVFKTALILFSSGSTGLPKGICLNHYSLMCNNLVYCSLLSSDKPFVFMGFSSAYWISWAMAFISAILSGQTRLFMYQFDTEKVWRYVERYKVKYMFCVTSQIARILKASIPDNLDISSLKLIHIGGAKVTTELLEAVSSKVPYANVAQAYGLSEIGCNIITPDREAVKRKPMTCGRCREGVWYKIVDLETEEILGPNQIGELRFKSKLQMNGYYNVDSSSAWDQDGWLKTGDLFYYDEEYLFYFVERIKGFIKYRGIHVQRNVLEDILLMHPAVAEAVVIGVPHLEDEEHPMAVVVLECNAGNITPEKLTGYVDERVDNSKKLRGGVKIVDELPVTPSGKVNVRELKRQICEELKIAL